MWQIGIAVRAGLHTGECERMGKKVGGLAGHIGPCVASLAGPGDVVLTSTVRDLALGSGTRFEERGSHSLKGVPNQWQVFALEHADRAPLADRPILGETRRRSRLPAFFAVGAVAIAVAVAVPLLTLLHHGTAPAGAPVVKALVPAGVVRIDPSTNEPVDGVPFDGAHTVIVANGFVWAAGREGVAKIYPRTGKIVAIVRPRVGHSRPAYPCGLTGVNNFCSLTAGGGRIWLVNPQAGAEQAALAAEA